MKQLVVGLVLVAGVLAGCTDADGARRTLEGMGFTEIQTGGYAYWSCSDDDSVSTKFTAKGPNGQIVSGAVCRGLFFKNSTVRFD